MSPQGKCTQSLKTPPRGRVLSTYSPQGKCAHPEDSAEYVYPIPRLPPRKCICPLDQHETGLHEGMFFSIREGPKFYLRYCYPPFWFHQSEPSPAREWALNHQRMLSLVEVLLRCRKVKFIHLLGSEQGTCPHSLMLTKVFLAAVGYHGQETRFEPARKSIIIRSPISGSVPTPNFLQGRDTSFIPTKESAVAHTSPGAVY